ncbi:MAG TPA: M48 family metalloprotease [Trichocoleus sp.]
MKSWKRFLAALLAGLLIALLGGQSIPFSLAPGVAAETAPAEGPEAIPTESGSAVPDASTSNDSTSSDSTSGASTPDASTSDAPVPSSTSSDPASLEVEEVSSGDTLPVPTSEPPDGTLKVPEELRTPYPTSEESSPPPEGASGDPADPAASYTPEQLLAGLEPDAAERARLLMAGDQLYLVGNSQAATTLYRQAKDPLWEAEADAPVQVEPLSDPEQLPPAAAVYWREAKAGAETGLETRMLVPLELLVRDYPEFLPGQALYVEYLIERDRTEEAAAVIERAIARYPFNPDLLKAQTQVLMHQEKWLEAAITARQFTLFNPDHPDNEAMLKLSQDNTDRFRAAINERLTGNLLTNIFTGAAGYILTGGLLGPFTAINSSFILLQGESGIGARVANQAVNQLPIMADQSVNEYVDAVGQKLAALAGRDEFDYDFHVVMDDTLNAFALPGGKVFVNAGALLKTHSEAELAGLLSHEISHAALSHGFQLVTQGNLTTSLAAFIPIPEVAGLAANLVVSGYSREMERQADVLGTQILAVGNYAADGLHNLMVTLGEEKSDRSGISWFSSHPAPDERVGYLKQLIDQGGFNRFAYEGVEPHLKVRKQVEKLMVEYKRENAAEEQQQPQDRPQDQPQNQPRDRLQL